MNRGDSGVILSETELINADVFHARFICAEKQQVSGTALFSAEYLWDFHPVHHAE